MTMQWFQAAKTGDLAFVRKHIQQFARSQSPRSGRTALMHAVRGTNIEIATLLAQKEAGITDFGGRTALMYAAQHGDCQTVRLLLSEQNTCCTAFGVLKDATALQLAANYSNIAAFMLLQCEKGLAELGDSHIAAFLHQRAADDRPDSLGRSPLHYAVLNPQDASDAFYNQFSVFSDDVGGMNPLFLAIQAGNVCYAAFACREQPALLQRRCTTKYGKDTTPLMWAVEWRRGGIVKLLLQQQGQQTASGVTALAIALLRGYNEFIVPLFRCEFGLNVAEYQRFRGTSPFDLARQIGNLRGLEILRLLQYQACRGSGAITASAVRGSAFAGSHTGAPKFAASTSTVQQFNSGVLKRSASASLTAHDGDLRLESLRPGGSAGGELEKTQQLCNYYREQLSKSAQEQQRRDGELLNQLKSFRFDESWGVVECVNELVRQNTEVRSARDAERLECTRLKQEVAEQSQRLEEMQRARQPEGAEAKSPQGQIATLNESNAQEQLEVLASQCADQASVQNTQLGVIGELRNTQKYVEIFAFFYGDSVPAYDELRCQAQTLASVVNCGFQDAALLLNDMNEELNRAIAEKGQYEARISAILGAIGAPHGADPIKNLEIVEQELFDSLQALKQQDSKELYSRLDHMQGSLKMLNSQHLIDNQENLSLEELNAQLTQENQGLKAEMAALRKQLSLNINYRRKCEEAFAFIAQAVQRRDPEIPDDLDQTEKDVFAILKKQLESHSE